MAKERDGWFELEDKRHPHGGRDFTAFLCPADGKLTGVCVSIGDDVSGHEYDLTATEARRLSELLAEWADRIERAG